jgi:DNA-binding transcriptional LysR family regulator
MEIYQLRTFVTVAKLGHLTKASEALHLTQPAVTAQIKALEQELGIALFDRRHGRVIPTKAAEMLLPEAEKTLAMVNALLGKAKQIKGEVVGRFLIGTLGDPDFLRLGGFLSTLLSALPLLEIKTRTVLAEDILEGVRAGELIGGFYIGSAADAELINITLRGVCYRIVAPVSLADELAVAGWRKVAALPWIGAPARSHLFKLLKEIFGRQGLEPNIVMETDDLASLHSLVRSGVGLALMREDQAIPAVERGELFIWGHARIESELSFVYHTRSEHDPAVVGLVSVLRDAWGLKR